MEVLQSIQPKQVLLLLEIVVRAPERPSELYPEE
jgi:hypothetical protein